MVGTVLCDITTRSLPGFGKGGRVGIVTMDGVWAAAMHLLVVA